MSIKINWVTSKIKVLLGEKSEIEDDSLSVLTTLDKSSSTTRISHISLTASKDNIILVNSFHLKVRSFNRSTISRPLKQLSKNIAGGVLKNSYSQTFCKLLSKDLWRSLFLEKFNTFIIFFWTLLDGCAGSM